MMRTFDVDVLECPQRHGRLRIIEAVVETDAAKDRGASAFTHRSRGEDYSSFTPRAHEAQSVTTSLRFET
jgi:hypothetical protein